MSNPWFDLQETYWDTLRADSDYAQLGLHEFPIHEGRLLPFDLKSGVINGDRLPCHGTLVTAAGTEDFQGIEGQLHDFIRIKGAICFDTTEDDRSSRAIENAMAVLVGIVQRPMRSNVLLTALGGRPFEWSLGEGPIAIRIDHSAFPRQWAWFYDLTLYGAVRRLN